MRVRPPVQYPGISYYSLLKTASRFRDAARAAARAATLHGQTHSSSHPDLRALGNALLHSEEAVLRSPFMGLKHAPEPPAFTRAFWEHHAAKNPVVQRQQLLANRNPSSPTIQDALESLATTQGHRQAMAPARGIPGPRPGEGMKVRQRAPNSIYISPAEELMLRRQNEAGVPVVGHRRERPVEPRSGAVTSLLRRLGLG